MSDQIIKMDTEMHYSHNPAQSNLGHEENIGDLMKTWEMPPEIVQKVLDLNITLDDLKRMQPTDLDFMFLQDEAHLKAKLKFRKFLAKWKYKTIFSEFHPEAPCVSLDEILRSSKKGHEFLELASLSGKTQKKLGNCVADYFLERGILPSLQQLNALADDIVEKFPGQSKAVFFEPQGLLCRKIQSLNQQEADEDEMDEPENDTPETIEDVKLKEILCSWNLTQPLVTYRKLRANKITLQHLRWLENFNIDQIFRKEVTENVELKRELANWKSSLGPIHEQPTQMEVVSEQDQELWNQLKKNFNLKYPEFVFTRLTEYGVDWNLLPHLMESDLCDLFKLSIIGLRSRVELRRDLKIYTEQQKKLEQEAKYADDEENSDSNSRQQPGQLPRNPPTLNEILQDCATGVSLYAKRHQALEDEDKRDLVQIIVQYIVQKGITMNQVTFQYFADEIQRVFPQERKEQYYRHAEDGRQSGKLYNKYRNDGRRLRRILQRANNRV